MAYPAELISHWSTLIEGLEASPMGFFQAVEEGVKRRAIPDVAVSRIDFYEGGIFSAKREYLRITRGKLTFDICAAPYGTGFFVSWWLGTAQPSMLLSIPVVGFFLRWFVKPDTYYSLDVRTMFQTATHNSVLEAVDGLSNVKGLRALSEIERRPTLRDSLAA